MNPTEFICGLMRQNTDAVGFIPRPTIEQRFVPRNHYLIQTNRFLKPVGYLIHGPVHPDRTLHIHQACIELSRRNRHFGAQAVHELIDRAIRHQARTILLRCATDLDAVSFWASLGFLPYSITPAGARRQRTLIRFRLDVTQPRPSPKPESGSGPHPAGPAPEVLAH